MPGGIMPLRLFEPRYLRMVSDCLKTDTGFGICLIKDGGESGAPALPYHHGTLSRIVDFDQGDDGLLHITARGEQEFTLTDIEIGEQSLLCGTVQLIERESSADISYDFSELAEKLSLILDHVEPHISFETRSLDDAEWVCNRLLELLPIEAGIKYDMLKTPDLQQRLQALDALQFSVAT